MQTKHAAYPKYNKPKYLKIKCQIQELVHDYDGYNMAKLLT